MPAALLPAMEGAFSPKCYIKWAKYLDEHVGQILQNTISQTAKSNVNIVIKYRTIKC